MKTQGVASTYSNIHRPKKQKKLEGDSGIGAGEPMPFGRWCGEVRKSCGPVLGAESFLYALLQSRGSFVSIPL